MTSRRLSTGVHAAALTIAFVAVVTSTWARWGSPRIDCGGALDRAARLAAGETLYRDVQSPYGPVSDYAVATTFRLFGTHLTVAYAVGIVVAAIASSLVWAIGRHFLSPLEATAGVLGFWVFSVFHPLFLEWLVPNTYAAPFGVTLALATLVLAIGDVERPATWRLVSGSLMAGLAGLSKVEFGLAAVGVLLVRAVGLAPRERSRRRLLILCLLPGGVLAAATLLVLLAFVPWRVLVDDNLYRVRSFIVTVPRLRDYLVHSPWPACHDALVHYGLVLPAWTVAIGWPVRWARRAGHPTLGIALAAIVLLVFARAPDTSFDFSQLFYATSSVFQWSVIGWTVIVAARLATDRCRSRPETSALVLAATFSVVATARWDFRVAWPEYYAPLAPLLLLFVVRTVAGMVVGQPAAAATALLFLAALVPNARLAWECAVRRDVLLDYPRGRMWIARGDDAGLKSVIDWVRANTDAEDYVSVIPEERLINFLAERRNPTPDSGIGPGWLATRDDRLAFLVALAAHRARAVVVSNRVYGEFGTGTIAEYAPEIVWWVNSACTPALRTGNFAVFDCRRAFAGSPDGSR